jgi:Domain of unknown function (DUF4926)
MGTALKVLDTVVVAKDLSQRGLRPGQIGTVVELLAPDIYEVEFSDDKGRSYATLALHETELRRATVQGRAQALAAPVSDWVPIVLGSVLRPVAAPVWRLLEDKYPPPEGLR